MRVREKAVWFGELIVIKLSAVRRAVQVVGVKRVGAAQRLSVDAIHGGGEASAGAARPVDLFTFSAVPGMRLRRGLA